MLDLEELRYADWARPERRPQRELLLARSIHRRIARAPWRDPHGDDGLPDGSRALEHHLLAEPHPPRADVLLVHRTKPELLLIECVEALRPEQPLPQLARCRRILEEHLGADWTIGPLRSLSRLLQSFTNRPPQTGCRRANAVRMGAYGCRDCIEVEAGLR